MTKMLPIALGALALGFVAAPVTVDVQSGTLTVQTAAAKHGADDVVPDDRGGARGGKRNDDTLPDDKGGKGGKGGKRNDDPKPHR